MNERVATGAALFIKSDEIQCAYCRGKHQHEQCTKVTSLDDRKKLIRKYDRCFLCMKKGHRAKDCRSKERCKNCKMFLHTSICDKQVSKEVQETSTNEIPEVTATSVHASSGGWGRIVLQTAQGFVTSENGHQSVRCRKIMFDSGSQKSYISTELADLLKVTPKTTECLEIHGFGKQGATVRGRVFDVKVGSVNKKNPIFLEICEVPTIAKFQNVHAEL